MKILIVSGNGDFCVTSFCAKYDGYKVCDLLKVLDFVNGEKIDEDSINYEIKEFNMPLTADIEEFLRFIKQTFCDYDSLKAQDFFLENETIVY